MGNDFIKINNKAKLDKKALDKLIYQGIRYIILHDLKICRLLVTGVKKDTEILLEEKDGNITVTTNIKRRTNNDSKKIHI